MDRKKLLEGLLNKKKLSILQLFLRKPKEQFYLKEISKQTKVPLATVYRIINQFSDMRIVDVIKLKNFKVYTLANNELIKFISSFIEDRISAIDEFVTVAKTVKGVELIILHGETNKNKASIVIIGSLQNQTKLKQEVFKAKEKYDFSISLLTLEKKQFQQMRDMGLYAGEKKILFSK